VRTSLLHCPPVAIAETLAGGPGIVDLWYWQYESAMDEALVAAGVSLMTGEEHERYRRLRFEPGRRLFLATRVLVREVLSRYISVNPAEWRFVSDPAGKPRIAQPVVSPTLHFNLANTSGLVVCGVTAAHEAIGVDAERSDRPVDYTALAARFFAPTEADDVRAQPPERRARRFFEYWTLKESYIKARGLGLRLPLDQFAFDIGHDKVGVSFTSPALDHTRWRFASVDAAPAYLIAIGAETGGTALSLRAAAFAPAS